MATYEIWYSEIETFKAWIDAKNEDDLQSKLEAAREGSTTLAEITNNTAVFKGYDYEIDEASIMELKEND